ncbi:hypothetical protein ACWKSP_26220 [Micromonosporaceae bacterium Da 78-11]
MTAPILFDLSAALEAVARDEEGVDLLPGDRELIAAHEGFCQQEWDAFQDRCAATDLADWLADQCPAHEDGGRGPVCDECAEVAA